MILIMIWIRILIGSLALMVGRFMFLKELRIPMNSYRFL